MILYLQIAITFLIGALAVALQSLIAERVSLKWRGVILTIPSTMAVGFFFIGLIKTPADVAVVAKIFPAALGADYFFVMIFALFLEYGVGTSLVLSTLGFFSISLGILYAPPESFFLASLWGFSLIIICYFVVTRLPQSDHLKPYPMDAKHIGSRGIIGGTVACLMVLLSKTLGNVWGGIFSAFPANFSSTLLIYSRLQGKHVIPSVAKSLFFPGAVGFTIYALTSIYAFPRFGIWVGTLICYATSISFAVIYAHVTHKTPIITSG